MFPKSHHPPTFPFKLFADFAISEAVFADLLSPVTLVGGRLSAMKRAAMPKTTVYKDSNLAVPENEIRLADNSISPPPAFDVIPPQN